MKRALILGLLFSFKSFAAVKGDLNSQLSRYRNDVVDLGARLSTLEKEIGSKNNLYLSGLEQIKQFEKDIQLYRDRLHDIQLQVQKAQLDNKKILKSYLAESENDATESWQRKVHLELLKQADSKLKAKEVELTTYDQKIKEFDHKLAALKLSEEELAKLIADLETRKKEVTEKYLATSQGKKRVEALTHKQKINVAINQVRKEFSHVPVIESRPDRIFSRPVEDFLTYVPSQKGVTFKYQSIQPVKAVGVGKVVFAGDLSNYGQVVLIDHGDDLRTVLLGRMDIKVKKNDTVEDGDILAYTSGDLKEAQNLYFEVRKKNTAQNTILWLDLDGVSKI